MSDLIDRQNAIDVLEILADKMSDEGKTVMAQAVAVLKDLQSAEPEWNRRTQPAIIHCADCRWWKHDDTDSYGYCYACKSGTYTEHWEISIYRKYKGDFYCADAEIREKDDYE